MRNRITLVSVFFIFPLICFSNLVHAASSVEIDAKVDAALKDFYSKVGGGKELAEKAHGVLVFPSVIKAGLVIGGEYGEGALQMDGKTADYYSVAGASFGFQFGAQSKSVVLLFMEKKALSEF